MYERLPLDYIGLTDGFGKRKDPISGADSYHYAIDLGWHSYLGEPIYAIHDSKVVYESYDDNLGNYIVFSYQKNNQTIIYRFLHLRDRALVKKGATVKRGQKIGYMGTTGYSTGVHLHFEYWICPKNYTYYFGDRSKYAVNPLGYCYLFEDQTANATSISLLTKVVGNKIKVARDKSKNQIEIVGERLRCRKEPNLKGAVLGYIDYGIYNILDQIDADNYTWYKIDEDKWVANVTTDVKLYLIESVESEIEGYKKFIAPKEDYYYIYLKEQEVIYFKK